MAYRATTDKQDREFLDDVIGDTFLYDDVLPWIEDNLKPDQVFDEDVLGAWAEKNGYTKREGL